MNLEKGSLTAERTENRKLKVESRNQFGEGGVVKAERNPCPSQEGSCVVRDNCQFPSWEG